MKRRRNNTEKSELGKYLWAGSLRTPRPAGARFYRRQAGEVLVPPVPADTDFCAVAASKDQ